MHILILKLANYFMATVGRFVFTTGHTELAGDGYSNFMALNTFEDQSRGDLVGLNCILKVNITAIPLGLQMTVWRLMVSARDYALQTWN